MGGIDEPTWSRTDRPQPRVNTSIAAPVGVSAQRAVQINAPEPAPPRTAIGRRFFQHNRHLDYVYQDLPAGRYQRKWQDQFFWRVEIVQMAGAPSDGTRLSDALGFCSLLRGLTPAPPFARGGGFLFWALFAAAGADQPDGIRCPRRLSH